MMPLRTQISEKALFGPFELNIKTGELFERGDKVRLSGQAAQLVVILVQRPGELVTRQELRTVLWPGDTFVDFGHGLNNCISRIRDALGDSAVSPRYIQTLPKQGYRFVGELRTPAEGLKPRPEIVAAPSPLPWPPPTIQPSLKGKETTPANLWKWIVITNLLCISATAIAVWAADSSSKNQ
jgi:DNA-binding winged helix-turn-helix (wHTH) protein